MERDDILNLIESLLDDKLLKGGISNNELKAAVIYNLDAGTVGAIEEHLIEIVLAVKKSSGFSANEWINILK